MIFQKKIGRNKKKLYLGLTKGGSQNNKRRSIMKKLLITLVCVFLTLSSYSQSKKIYGYELNVGIKDGGMLVWDRVSEPVYIPILIENKKLTIFSEDTQVYNFITLDVDSLQKKVWYCTDSKNRNCYLSINNEKVEPTKYIIIIEYDDVAWFYTCTTKKLKNNFQK
jgi:hypothetical protein